MTEMNKTIAVKTMQALDRRDLDSVHANMVPNSRFYGWAPETLDADGHKAFMAGLLAAFPDSRFIVDDVIAEGDKLVTRWSAHGTHTGELMGIPPTGRKVLVSGTAIDRFENGQSVEHWEIFDQVGLMQQLGVIPA
jgi:predicted ester cyclase